MNRSIVFILVLSAIGARLVAQPAAPGMVPGRSLELTATKQSYKDSAEFAKVFKEIFPIVGPKKTVQEDAKEYLARMSRSFTVQGIDSVKADSVALIGLDADAYRKIYFTAYRSNLTAIELKKYLDFVKTPEGKKVLSVLPQLERLAQQSNSYIAQLINTNVSPLRQEAFERMRKERPPTQRNKVPSPIGVPGTPGVPPGGMTPPEPPSPPIAPQPKQ
ncbi:MAG: DUF2059 domain-containing protein [Bacteroidetes bacterium]|nr:DUF2059 domain-containing protein [Bacteroidota bacterium]